MLNLLKEINENSYKKKSSADDCAPVRFLPPPLLMPLSTHEVTFQASLHTLHGSGKLNDAIRNRIVRAITET